MKGHRVWKITKAIGVGAGVPEIHPHAFRHSSGVELLRLTRGLQSLFEPVLPTWPPFVSSRSRLRGRRPRAQWMASVGHRDGSRLKA
jgi:integrase